MPDHYFHRFRKRLFKELGEFVKAQLAIGFILTGLIIWWQVRTGIITTPNIRANVSSFVWPYLVVLVAFTVYHFGRTAYLLDREAQKNIRDLHTELTNITAPILPNLHFESILKGTMGSGVYQRPKISLFFRNSPKPSEAVATASIRAALRWKRGDEIRNVSPLAWLDSDETAITIGVGETAELIIGIQRPDGMWDFGVSRHIGPTDAVWIDEQPFEFEVMLLNTQNGRLFTIHEPLTFRWSWRETSGHTSRPWIEPIERPEWTL